MIFVQKNFSLQLPSEKRIQSVLALDLSHFVVVNTHSIYVIHVPHNTVISSFNINAESIIQQVHFHPFLNSLLLITMQIKNNRKNWQIIQISLSNGKLDETKIIIETKNHETKYQGMQLNPKVVIFPQSAYYVFLRQFYNDSEAIIISNGQVTQSFYINQERLSALDQRKLMVSFRALFKNRIYIQILDISEPVSIKKNGNTLIRYIEYDDSGVVNYVRKNEESGLLILSVNLKNNLFGYILFNVEGNEIVKSITKPNCKLLYFFHNFNSIVASLQQIEKQSVLCLQNSSDFIARDQMRTKLKYEEWSATTISEDEIIILNYSQNWNNQEEVNINAIRVAPKQEVYISILEQKMGDDQTLIEQVWNSLNHSNAQK